MFTWLKGLFVRNSIPRCDYCGALVDLPPSTARKVCGSEACQHDADLEAQLGL